LSNNVYFYKKLDNQHIHDYLGIKNIIIPLTIASIFIIFRNQNTSKPEFFYLKLSYPGYFIVQYQLLLPVSDVLLIDCFFVVHVMLHVCARLQELPCDTHPFSFQYHSPELQYHQ